MGRVKVTLSLDEGWLAEIDRRRRLVPRSRFVEALAEYPAEALEYGDPVLRELASAPALPREVPLPAERGYEEPVADVWPPPEPPV